MLRACQRRSARTPFRCALVGLTALSLCVGSHAQDAGRGFSRDVEASLYPGESGDSESAPLRDGKLERHASEPGKHQLPRESTQPRFRLRGRIDTDFLWTDQNAANRETFGDLNDKVGLRRARIGAEGHLSSSSRYAGEIDFATGDVVLRDAYFGLGDVQERGEFKFGHMREPFSLEGGTSANTFAFMERSPINVLDPARNWGVDLTRSGRDERWTFAAGVFQTGTDPSDVEYGPGSMTAITTRGTALGWYESHGEQLMHFGLAFSERIPNQGVVSIKEQPQSPLLDFGDSSESPFVPTITISADFQQLVNVQWACVHKSFWTQAEWYGTMIDQTGGGSIFYHGSYIDLGYFLTGEHRSYLTHAGFFGPLSVRRPVFSQFSSKSHEERLGFGAWEATCRFSYLNFVDGDTPTGPQGQAVGVRLPLATFGVN
jgi:phosphate-selective porin OprO and OprP